MSIACNCHWQCRRDPRLDWQAVDCRTKDVWKSTTTVNGERSVMMGSATLTQQLLAGVYLAPGKLPVFVLCLECHSVAKLQCDMS